MARPRLCRRHDAGTTSALLAIREAPLCSLVDLSIASLQLVKQRGWDRAHRRGNYAALGLVLHCMRRLMAAFDWL